MEQEVAQKKAFNLPLSVVTPIDIARLIRELDGLDEYLRQMSLRQGQDLQELPNYSRMLDGVVHNNNMNLLDGNERQSLKQQLINLQKTAPVLHISFSAEPPGSYVQKIVDWLRQNLDPLILVRVGLQPNIGAGCIVRTPNRQFDLSLRSYFDSKHDFFMRKLHEVLSGEEEPIIVAESPVEATAEETVPAAEIKTEASP